ncbi:MAG: glutamine synthetase [Planctomycetota bacterium]|nr:MAG: glutamine synthetase [Planctomycetota bacterium]
MSENKKIETKLKQYQEEGVRRVKLAFADIDGVLRGKYVSLEKFESIVTSTSGFCDCVLGWDLNDQLYDNAKYTGWHTAYPDAKYKVDLSTERRLVGENNTPFFLIEFVADDEKSLHPICPRSLLKRVLGKAETMGYGLNLAFEYEFFLFDETPHTVREKNYKNLTPFTPGNFGYSILRSNTESDLFHEYMDFCEDMDFPLEALHCETGPGVWEGALLYDEALKMADKASMFKTFTKSFFQERGLMATFMAKWSMDYPGQSGHVHQSLYDLKSKNSLFYDKDKPFNMSGLMEMYVAGQQEYLKPFLPMCSPTINSYARLVKGAWAPTTATWGVENRTTALRAIPGNAQSQRVEFRLGSADANPYLVAAAIIGAGLTGIEKKLKLSKPIQGNAYEQEEKLPEKWHLPSNLLDATRGFSKSKEAKELFGKEFVEHFTSSREWEVREYEKTITDWQLQRYFEII